MNYYHLLLIFLLSFRTLSQSNAVTLFFDTNIYHLNSNHEQILDSLIPVLENGQISITGAADTTGSEDFNKTLSLKRAQSIEDYLQKNGVAQHSVIEVQGIGESENFKDLNNNRYARISYTLNKELTEEKNVEVPERKNESHDTVKMVADHLMKTKDGQLNQNTIENLQEGDILNIGGLEFQGGRHVLTPDSKPVLMKLVKILHENPSMKIEIQGHICCKMAGDGVDLDTGTNNLSENRAKSIYVTLIREGIDENRLTYYGYGSTRKLVEETDHFTQQRNRRVSILILSK